MIEFFILYFFPVLFTIIGLVILLLHFKMQSRNRSCTCQTTGKVIRIIKRSDRSGRIGSVTHRYYRVPCFQYFVNGCAYTVEGYSAKLYPLGSVATIYYNPLSPDIAHTGERDPALKIGISFLLAAVLVFIFWSSMLKAAIYFL